MWIVKIATQAKHGVTFLKLLYYYCFEVPFAQKKDGYNVTHNLVIYQQIYLNIFYSLIDR